MQYHGVKDLAKMQCVTLRYTVTEFGVVRTNGTGMFSWSSPFVHHIIRQNDLPRLVCCERGTCQNGRSSRPCTVLFASERRSCVSAGRVVHLQVGITYLTCMNLQYEFHQCRELATGLHQSWPRLHELWTAEMGSRCGQTCPECGRDESLCASQRFPPAPESH
jgi:hypothetical protein